MDKLDRSDRGKMSMKGFMLTGIIRATVNKILLAALFCLVIPAAVQASDTGEIAVLPFRIHSLEPQEHLKRGLQEMLTNRLTGEGLQCIDPDVVNRHPMAFLPVFEQEDLLAVGRELKAAWVVLGSLTQVGMRVSLDLKVVDASGVKSPFSIFMVEDDIDRLASAAERAATSIYNKITGVVQIDSIQVRGNRRIESDAILAVVESKKGERLDPDQLDKDLRTIYKMGFFTDVNIKTEDGAVGKVVVLQVKEKPSIASISFSGNKEVKDKALNEEVGIKLYIILNRSEVKQSVNRIRDLYRGKGFYNVRITEKIEELPNNTVSLAYIIKEGEKVHITKIQFVGNEEFDDDDLRGIMETKEKGFLSWFTKSGLLDRKKLEFDIQKVIAFYHNHGYIRARAGDPEVRYEEKEKGLTITTEIIEGHKYRVNNVRVEGDLIRPVDELLGRIKVKKEGFFNREVIREDIILLREICANDGYANAEVTVTRDKVIRRELKVVEGEYFSGEGLRKSARNLNRLGYFENVEVNTSKGSRDDLMILDIDVKERPTGSFNMGAGYSSFDRAMVMFEVAQNNLFGRGQKIKVSAKFGSKTTDFDIRFIEPWLFDKPLSAGFDLYKWKTEYNDYTRDSLGTAFSLGFPLGFDEFTRGSIRYAYDNSQITDVDNDAASAIKEMAGTNLANSVTFGVNRDSRNRFWNPSEGSINSLSF
ncbi:MAG: BamA/TamA family outer membrane protein, partial [Deltaproteobacteria bacterium]|nr:BamA/TamA family outer membrane protein [Deltaproteobacteria bacterium]